MAKHYIYEARPINLQSVIIHLVIYPEKHIPATYNAGTGKFTITQNSLQVDFSFILFWEDI